jgi:hypothetical protein
LGTLIDTGDKGVLATVDGMALLELRRAIADLVVSVVVKFDEDDNEAGVSNTYITMYMYVCIYIYVYIYI